MLNTKSAILTRENKAMRPTRKIGFTLIELLIVVAIIAILAAIAVPNFLEAQTRSKVSRTKSDMRSLSTAMESYYIDNNAYVACNSWGVAGHRFGYSNDTTYLERLSTPISYVTTGLLPDVFVGRKRSGSLIDGTAAPGTHNTDLAAWTGTPPEGDPDHYLYRTYLYNSLKEDPTEVTGISRALAGDAGAARAWFAYSAGPMEAYVNMGGVIANAGKEFGIHLLYDPTNGTVSFGQVFRAGSGGLGSSDNIMGAIAHGMN
jgi:general secretion pathway protein G